MHIPLSAIMLVMLGGLGLSEQLAVCSLDGTWTFRLDPKQEGLEQGWQHAQFDDTVRLPGSLDENKKGVPNDEASRSHLSRLYHYVGPAWYQRDIDIPPAWADKPLEVFLERCHWETRLWVDDEAMGVQDSLCTPHVYALGVLTPGKHRITLRVNNSVKYDVGLRAHSITEHTQTNWNGVVGRMELRALNPVRIASIQVFPNGAQRTAAIKVSVINSLHRSVSCRVRAAALGAQQEADLVIAASGEGEATATMELEADAPLWDEFNPRLIDLDIRLMAEDNILDHSNARFGLRDLGRTGSQLTLNGRPYFVRGTLECCIFPLTGYPSMDVASWRHMMETARHYGLNHFRFHSWCPPEAAFVAADEAGVTLQIETPVWTDLGKYADLDQFIRDEADRILRDYGNHPSFAMLAVGNEPSGPNKDAFLADIVSDWQRKDARRLYTTCSGWPELPISDFHVVHERNKKPYRLHGGPLGPNTLVDYRDVLEGCARPAIAHELGQWCVYPDYREIPNYTGALRARNLEGFRESLRLSGMLDQAREFAWASGRLQRLMYKADIEALLRTPGAGGFQLLALQDFSGQGSALEGFLDAFWNSKGAVTPDEFRRFCSETVPLLRLEKLVWTNEEILTAKAEIAHFGANPLEHARPSWVARTADGREVGCGEWPEQEIPIGNGIPLGDIRLPLSQCSPPEKITLSVFLAGTAFENSWDIWVYPATDRAHDLGRVEIAEEWSNHVAARLRRGGKVLLLPKHIAPARRVKSAFEPIFWNTQWFPGQDRQLGILCDSRHPAFAEFPNDGHTDWQWWELLHPSTIMRLDNLGVAFRPLVQVIDDWNKNRLLGAVFEAKVGKGRLMVCTLDIQHDLEHRPAANALRRSLLQYMNSDRFTPQQSVSPSWLRDAFAPGDSLVAQVEADSAEPGYAPENAVDGKPDTIWHTPWSEGASGFPHELRICFTKELRLAGLRCLPRQDVANGLTNRYEVYCAKDGRNWGQPIAVGEFTVGIDEKVIDFAEIAKSRWLRFVAMSSATNESFAALAEVKPILAGEE